MPRTKTPATVVTRPATVTVPEYKWPFPSASRDKSGGGSGGDTTHPPIPARSPMPADQEAIALGRAVVAAAKAQFEAEQPPPDAPGFVILPLHRITRSPWNRLITEASPGMAELADSIKASGVHQPILVRPLPGSRMADTAHLKPRPTHELVAGERRWLASKMANQLVIPVMVCTLSDSQAIEVQLIENLQRESLSPLEEAQGFEHLREVSGLKAEDIAAKIGKSRRYVYARLQLLQLCTEGKAALQAGHIEARHALEICKIPSAKLQGAAVQYMQSVRQGGSNPTTEQLAMWMRSNALLDLASAPFDCTSASLVPKAGACATCPKRTGANPDLFEEVIKAHSADLCTDPPCYHGKTAATREALIAKATAKGQRFISAAEAMQENIAQPYSTSLYDYSPLTELREDARSFVKGQPTPTLGQLLGKDAPAPVLIEHPKTKLLIEAVPTDEAEAVLLAKGLIKTGEELQAEHSKTKALSSTPQERLKDLRAHLARLQKNRDNSVEGQQIPAEEEAILSKAAHIEGGSYFSTQCMRLWVEATICTGPATTGKEICKRLGLAVSETANKQDAIYNHVARCNEQQLWHAFLLALLETASNGEDGEEDAAYPLRRHFITSLGINPADIQQRAKAIADATHAPGIEAVQKQIAQAEADCAPAKPKPPKAPKAAKAGQGAGQKASA